MTIKSRISIRVVSADALEFKADVLALKYARNLYGVDRAAFERLIARHPAARLPDLAAFSLYNTSGVIAAEKILFLRGARVGARGSHLKY